MEYNGLFVVLFLYTLATNNGAVPCYIETDMTVNTEYVIFNSLYPDYNGDNNCTWTLNFPSETQIEMACPIFDMGGMRGRCNWPDKLEIIETNGNSPNHYRYCGTYPVHEVFLTNKLRIEWVTRKMRGRFLCKFVAWPIEDLDMGHPAHLQNACPHEEYAYSKKAFRCVSALFIPFTKY